MPTDKKGVLLKQRDEAKKKVAQIENRQKILLNKQLDAERRTRNHRLIAHGAILEGVFPAAANTKSEAVNAFLSHCPVYRE